VPYQQTATLGMIAPEVIINGFRQYRMSDEMDSKERKKKNSVAFSPLAYYTD
jgi:hypothetical protein